MNRPASITSQIKGADPELRNYVLELERENLRLQNQVAKLQVKQLSQQNEIKALKKTQTRVKLVMELPPERL